MTTTWLVVLFLAGLAALVLGLALFRGSVRVRLRRAELACPRCLYSLRDLYTHGAAGQRCPECGAGLNPEKPPRGRRVHRRGMALAAVAFVAAGGVAAVYSSARLWDAGVVHSYAPPGALVWSMQRGDDLAFLELLARLDAQAWTPSADAVAELVESAITPFERLDESDFDRVEEHGWTADEDRRADLVWSMLANARITDSALQERILQALMPARVHHMRRAHANGRFAAGVRGLKSPGTVGPMGKVVRTTRMNFDAQGRLYQSGGSTFTGFVNDLSTSGSSGSSSTTLPALPPGDYAAKMTIHRWFHGLNPGPAAGPNAQPRHATRSPVTFPIDFRETVELPFEVVPDDVHVGPPIVEASEHAARLSEQLRVMLLIELEPNPASNEPDFREVLVRTELPDPEAAPDLPDATIYGGIRARFDGQFEVRDGMVDTWREYTARKHRPRWTMSYMWSERDRQHPRTGEVLADIVSWVKPLIDDDEHGPGELAQPPVIDTLELFWKADRDWLDTSGTTYLVGEIPLDLVEIRIEYRHAGQMWRLTPIVASGAERSRQRSASGQPEAWRYERVGYRGSWPGW